MEKEILRVCPNCMKTINLSKSGFCTRCQTNYYATQRGRQDYDLKELAPVKKEMGVERKLSKFKSALIKIFKW